MRVCLEQRGYHAAAASVPAQRPSAAAGRSLCPPSVQPARLLTPGGPVAWSEPSGAVATLG